LDKASKSTKIDDAGIVKVCKGTRKTAGGFIWKYLDVNPNEQEVDLKGYRQIDNFPNYWINNKGEIYSKPYKKFLKYQLNADKGCSVQLTKKNPEGKGQIKKTFLVHRLVAQYFLKKDNEKDNSITHIDKNRSNNNVKNLKWCSIKGVENLESKYKKIKVIEV
jgi:hypothetical protein